MVGKGDPKRSSEPEGGVLQRWGSRPPEKGKGDGITLNLVPEG